ncbi:hypothetical protein NMG60_11020093 [Bertholletia excelsa]
MASPPLSSAIRFLGLTNRPYRDPNPTSFELDETDVVWSSDLSDSGDLRSPSPLTVPSSPVSLLHHELGLSAALSDDDDDEAVLRRKPALDPPLSAASAARTIPSAPRSSDLAAARFRQSAPVNVPVWPRKSGALKEEEEKEMIPPHVIVARSRVTTFSVLEGVGRTLKGRDLRRVRNAVFQKTGFID